MTTVAATDIRLVAHLMRRAAFGAPAWRLEQLAERSYEVLVEELLDIESKPRLEEDLLERVNAVAENLNVSRSRLFVRAVEEFIQGLENKNLLKSLNAAYGSPPDEEEERFAHHVRTKQRDQLQENVW